MLEASGAAHAKLTDDVRFVDESAMQARELPGVMSRKKQIIPNLKV